MGILSASGDAAFCSGDAELLGKFELAWWPPLLAVFGAVSGFLTLLLAFCLIVFRKCSKPQQHRLGTCACCCNALVTIYCYLAMPGPLLMPQDTLRMTLMFVSYSGSFAIVNTLGFIAVHGVRQISTFDVSFQLDIPKLKLLWYLEIVFGVLPPYLAVVTLAVYGSSGCHIAGNSLRIIAAFATLPQVTTLMSWLSFGSLAFAALSKYEHQEIVSANKDVWLKKVHNLKIKVLVAGSIEALVNIVGMVLNGLAGYTLLLDESVEFHCFIRIIGIVFVVMPSLNIISGYSEQLNGFCRSARNRKILPLQQNTHCDTTKLVHETTTHNTSPAKEPINV